MIPCGFFRYPISYFIKFLLPLYLLPLSKESSLFSIPHRIILYVLFWSSSPSPSSSQMHTFPPTHLTLCPHFFLSPSSPQCRSILLGVRPHTRACSTHLIHFYFLCLCVYVSVCAPHAGMCARGLEEGTRVSGTGVIGS